MLILLSLVFAMGTAANSCTRAQYYQETKLEDLLTMVGVFVALAVLSLVVSRYRRHHGDDVGPIP